MPNTITQREYDQMVAELTSLAERIVGEKRKVYTQDSNDVLRNFRFSAQFAHTNVGQQIATHMIKQFVSVLNLLCRPDIDDKEKDTRFADLLNYLHIAYVAYKTGVAYERG